MSVKDFRSNSLSDKIVYSLIEATQAYSSMDVLLNEYPTIKPVLHDMLLFLDIYYDRYDTYPDIADIYFGLYIPNQMTESGINATVIRACLEYAQNKVQMTDILTAGDILRIDKAIKNVDIEHLAINEPSDKIDAVWSILHDLYGPKHQYPLLLETAIACYRLLTLSDTYHLSQQSLVVLFSVFHKNTLAFRGLPKQWILSTDPQTNIALMDFEDALVYILSVFQQIWVFTTTLIRKLNHKKEEIYRLIKSTASQQASAGFNVFLSENICIRNKDVSEKLCVSPKTAINHLKQLEQEKILFSIKNGREIFYFNNILLDLLKQTIEVTNNGTEKP